MIENIHGVFACIGVLRAIVVLAILLGRRDHFTKFIFDALTFLDIEGSLLRILLLAPPQMVFGVTIHPVVWVVQALLVWILVSWWTKWGFLERLKKAPVWKRKADYAVPLLISVIVAMNVSAFGFAWFLSPPESAKVVATFSEEIAPITNQAMDGEISAKQIRGADHKSAAEFVRCGPYDTLLRSITCYGDVCYLKLYGESVCASPTYHAEKTKLEGLGVSIDLYSLEPKGFDGNQITFEATRKEWLVTGLASVFAGGTFAAGGIISFIVVGLCWESYWGRREQKYWETLGQGC